jgi:hypothetical protein
MRAIAVFATLIVAGCAPDAAQLPVTTKMPSAEKTATQGFQRCVPEPEPGCITIKTRQACVAHFRCKWTDGNGTGGYCHKIYC